MITIRVQKSLAWNPWYDPTEHLMRVNKNSSKLGITYNKYVALNSASFVKQRQTVHMSEAINK